MAESARGEILREVGDDAATSRMAAFARSVGHGGGHDGGYGALWRWSVAEPAAFWRAVIDFFDLQIFWDEHDAARTVLADASMPGARWLPGARLSYPMHALREQWSGPAVVGVSQTRERVELSYDELHDAVGRATAGLRRLGVGPGDRVAGYLPHVPEAIVAFLAAASLGAVWVCCPPEFGVRAVLDRLGQVDPTVLVAVDGSVYGAKEIDRTEALAEIRAGLPSLRATVLLGYLRPDAADVVPDVVAWADLLAEPRPVECLAVPFDHPLYVLFSSGTTGLPKPIVHGHGGIVLDHHKTHGLHHDIHPGERFFWFSTTGWMMWNFAVSALLHGGTVVCFDGDPGHPDLDRLWTLAADERLNHFGTSASFLMTCRSAGLRPGRDHDLSALRTIGSTGSPLPAEGFRWVYDVVDPAVLLSSASGGTDVCTPFVGGAPLLPVRAGEISGPILGVDVHAYDSAGRPVVGEPGELVVTAPMPSMPVALWGDDDGSRMRSTWFEHFEGVWTQGDWITFHEDGACVISGRSDATLNRGGVRLGTSDFYSVVEEVEGVTDSLVVHLEDVEGGTPGTLVLFVVGGSDAAGSDAAGSDAAGSDAAGSRAAGSDADGPAGGESGRASLEREIVARLRGEMSPRHAPDEIVWLDALPRTLSGKKLETPVKRLLLGAAVDDVASRDSLLAPEALDAVVTWRDTRGRAPS